MIKTLLFLTITILTSCQPNKKEKNPITSVEIEISLSFGECSKFIINTEKIESVIFKNWRINDSKDYLYQFDTINDNNLQEWEKIASLFPKGTDSFRGTCNDLDGWFLSGKIHYQNNKLYRFSYQHCGSDSVAHKTTPSIISNLQDEFKHSAIIADYLLETQYNYKGQKN